ncbi:uncharacterized protein [Cherax quadricarinatus]|nr:uncharacterized protein LOC128703470 [Cherax quadricarinatus]
MKTLVILVVAAVVAAADRTERSADPSLGVVVHPLPYARQVVQYVQPRVVVRHHSVIPYRFDDDDDLFDRKKRSADPDDDNLGWTHAQTSVVYARPVVQPVVHRFVQPVVQPVVHPVVQPVVHPVVQPVVAQPYYQPGHVVLSHGYDDDK